MADVIDVDELTIQVPDTRVDLPSGAGRTPQPSTGDDDGQVRCP